MQLYPHFVKNISQFPVGVICLYGLRSGFTLFERQAYGRIVTEQGLFRLPRARVVGNSFKFLLPTPEKLEVVVQRRDCSATVNSCFNLTTGSR